MPKVDLKSATDAYLVQQIVMLSKGDDKDGIVPEAKEVIRERYYKVAVNEINKYGLPIEHARELVEVMFEKLEDFAHEWNSKGSFESWFLNTARQKAQKSYHANKDYFKLNFARVAAMFVGVLGVSFIAWFALKPKGMDAVAFNTTGSVFVNDRAYQGGDIRSGSVIRTTTGETDIRVGDSVIHLNNNTEVRIDASTQRGNDNVEVRVETGAALFDVAKQSERDSYRVSTPYATVDIIGTRFAVSTGDNADRISVVEGEIRFENEQFEEAITANESLWYIHDEVSQDVQVTAIAEIDRAILELWKEKAEPVQTTARPVTTTTTSVTPPATNTGGTVSTTVTTVKEDEAVSLGIYEASNANR